MIDSSFIFIYFQAAEVEAVLANTKQILNQFLRKSRILLFSFVKPLCTDKELDKAVYILY